MTGTLTFIGTATTLIEYGGFTLLTDPNFLHRGQKAYLGKGLFSTRRTEVERRGLTGVRPLERGQVLSLPPA